jgi:hypothetical protein
VHIVPDHESRVGSGRRIRFKSSVTLWPPKLSKQHEKRLASVGWYRAIERAVGAGGYRGKWMPSPSGTFGDFWKELSGVAAVRREAAWLEGLEFEGTSRR